MKRVSIEYNPYLQQTIMKIGNIKISDDSAFSKYLNCPLANWIDGNPSENWPGFLPQLKNETKNDPEYEITFRGREIDFIDFEKAIELQKGNTRINIVKEILFSDEDMMKRVDAVYRQLLCNQFKEIVNGTNSASLKASYLTLPNDYENLKNNEFRIAVVGTYSSGKSTVINALIGQDILPSADSACTNKIWKIRHQKGIGHCLVSAFDESGSVVYNKVEFTPDIARELGAEECTAKSVDIFADLSHLYPDDIVNGLNLVLLDTPGSNNDNNIKDLEITKSILKSKDKEMLIYICNGKYVTSDDSGELLDMISEAMNSSNDMNNDRFLFLINHCDELKFKENSADTMEKTISECLKHLEKHGIHHARIFPISAQIAKIVKMQQQHLVVDDFDLQDLNNFKNRINLSNNYQFENYASLSAIAKNQIEETLRAIKEEVAATNTCEGTDIEIHSGFVSLEYAIRDYLLKYAYPLKIRNMLNTFRAILSEAQMWENVKKNFAESLQKDGEEKSKATEKQRREEEKIKQIEEMLISGEFAKETKQKIDNVYFDKFEITTIWEKIFVEISNIAEFESCDDSNEISAEHAKLILKSVMCKSEQLISGAVSESKRIIDCDVKNTIRALLNQYKLYLHKLNENGFLNLESFKFRESVAFNKVLKLDEDELITRSKTTGSKDGMVYNYDRNWDWGRNIFTNVIKKLTSPKMIPGKVSYEYYDFKKLFREYVNPITADLKENIQMLIDDVTQNISNLKKSTIAAMDECEEAISEKLRERAECLQLIAKSQEDQQVFEQQIQRIEENQRWIQGLYDTIQDILQPENF